MIRLLVTCAGDANMRFDRDYYVNKHLPLTLDVWWPHGLEAATAFFPPAGSGNGILSIGVYEFRDEDGIDAALASPQTARIMDDVKNFTDTSVIERSIWKPMHSTDGDA